jgi:hypothetical protein
MVHNEFALTRDAYVEFNPISALFPRSMKRIKGVS